MADSINYQLAKFVASYGKVSQIPESTCPEVSFVGRSNVGKSSIMNKLFGRKNLVKVSSTPGKTSNINFFEADDVHFVDLPVNDVPALETHLYWHESTDQDPANRWMREQIIEICQQVTQQERVRA